MPKIINHADFARVAQSYHDSHIPYNKLDCQGFVERVLSDCGVRCNYRGSNHMWRCMCSWRGTVEEAQKKFGQIPTGALLFTIRQDGGEIKRGYHDNEGNAAHIGIYTGQDLGAMHSTTGGVQPCNFPDSRRWTHIALCAYVDYAHDAPVDNPVDNVDNILSYLNTTLIKIIETAEEAKQWILQQNKL